MLNNLKNQLTGPIWFSLRVESYDFWAQRHYSSAKHSEHLGTREAGVSIALGRDVTDSFNRLVRGVTKAEPELLDELGIILRLDK